MAPVDHPSHFSRARSPGATSVELRGMCPVSVACALDALALARGLDRNTYVVQILSAHVEKEVDAASVLVRALKGNPLLSEDLGGTLE